MNSDSSLFSPPYIFLIRTSVILTTLLWAAVIPVTGGSPSSNLEFETEINLTPTELNLIPDYGSEICFSYETDSVEVESVMEFDQLSPTEEVLTLGFSDEQISAELKLVLLPGTASLESYATTGEVSFNPGTELKVDYEAGFCPASSEEDCQAELLIVLLREITDEISARIEGSFPNTGGSLSLTPGESKIKLTDIRVEPFWLDFGLELEGNQPKEIKIGYQSLEPEQDSFFPCLEGDINWEIFAGTLEVEPEFEFDLATPYLEGVVHLTEGGGETYFDLQEVGISDLEMGPLSWDFSRDFDSGEIEVELEVGGNKADFELEVELEPTEKRSHFEVDRLAGELTLEPSDLSKMTLEAETDMSSFPVGLSFTTGYSF